jgi:hypothetical protein
MDFSVFREVEQFIYFTKILAVVHGICIVIAVLPSIEIATRRIVIGIAAIAVVAYLIRFGYRFKNDDSVYLLYPIVVLIADVLFIVWPYLPRPTTSPNPPIPQEQPEPLMENIGRVVGATLDLLTPSSKQPSPSQQRSPAVPQQQQPQPFSDSGPVTGIDLRTKRGQKPGSWGKILFTLDARIDVSAENKAAIEKYRLGKRLIYESANREKYRARAQQHFENTRDQPGLFSSPGAQMAGFAKTMVRIGGGLINALAAAYSLKVTVNSLMEGHHIASEDMAEILDAESAFFIAKENLEAEIETARTFSDGQETIL